MNCSECGYGLWCDHHLGVDHRREYDGSPVCNSCLIDLKLENGDYSQNA